jgi:hypothetical protein
MKRVEIGTIVMLNREFNGLDSLEILIGESMQKTRLQPRLSP